MSEVNFKQRLVVETAVELYTLGNIVTFWWPGNEVNVYNWTDGALLFHAARVIAARGGMGSLADELALLYHLCWTRRAMEKGELTNAESN